MASTRYTIAATTQHDLRTMSNLKSARREADRRADATGRPVTVTTEATGRISYTATPQALPIADQAEVEAVLATDDRKEALTGVASVILRAIAQATQRAEDAPQGPVRPARPARREALGASVVPGWELLYDKPKQDAQVGRNDQGKYALICTRHNHAHTLPRLTAERGLRGGKRSAWCPSC